MVGTPVRTVNGTVWRQRPETVMKRQLSPSPRRLVNNRQFSLRGVRGQFVFVDPGSKLVLVQTAARGVGFQDEELFALWAALRSQ
jgi:hypothetical protein